MNKRHYEHTLPNIRGSLSNTYNAEVIARFFLPFSSVVWLVTEAEQQEDGDWLFFGYCHIQEWEWGYVLLSQIQEVNVRGLTVQLDKGLKTGITVKACLN